MIASVSVANTEMDSTSGTMLTTPVSASAAADPPSVATVVFSMLAVVAVAVVMCLAYRYWIKPTPIRLIAGYVPYAGVVAAAAALERFLEPLSKLLMPTDQKKQEAATSKTQAEAAAADPTKAATDVQPLVQAAARGQAVLATLRSSRALMFWAIASICGLAISGGFGLFLLQSVAKNHVNPYLDLLVTGLTIGAGTKPTHDLITSIQARATKSGT